MPVTKFPSRDFTYEINTGDSETPDWTEIGGINSVSHTPAIDRTDTQTFDTDGRHEHLVVGRGDAFSVEGFRLEDPVTGERDPGQAAVEATAQEIGVEAEAEYRITSPGGNTITFSATAEVTYIGGGVTDVAPWSVALEVTGGIKFESAGS